MIKLYKGDCLIKSDKIESGSVDLILTDLPYGTVKGLGNSRVAKEKKYNVSEWDVTIDTKKIFEIANRILRKNGKIILTANQPFTTELISNAIPNLPHSYNMYWDKLHFANCLIVNKAPVSYIEDILVFSKVYKKELRNSNLFIREYASKIRNFVRYNRRIFKTIFGDEKTKHFLEDCKNDNLQFNLCTKEVYNRLINHFNIDIEDWFITYTELVKINDKFKLENFNDNLSTFNLWEGNKYKSNILKYKKDYDGYHPTQKPVLLLEDLIKTFSNENDLVVDLTMGSGSTGVACLNTNRNFIGIEMNDKYFDIAINRMNGIDKQMTYIQRRRNFD